jgi:hypothetical protein
MIVPEEYSDIPAFPYPSIGGIDIQTVQLIAVCPVEGLSKTSGRGPAGKPMDIDDSGFVGVKKLALTLGIRANRALFPLAPA